VTATEISVRHAVLRRRCVAVLRIEAALRRHRAEAEAFVNQLASSPGDEVRAAAEAHSRRLVELRAAADTATSLLAWSAIEAALEIDPFNEAAIDRFLAAEDRVESPKSPAPSDPL